MTAVPQSGAKRRWARPSWPVIIAVVLVIALIATLVGRWITSSGSSIADAGTPVDVTRGPLVASINATGKVEPLQESQLAFAARDGRVQAVLVQVGEMVNQNAALVQLEMRQLAAEVGAAQAALAQAEASLQGLKDGATPEQIAGAEAQVASAQGGLRQTQGSVTAADVRAARLQVEEARARLATLQGAPNPDAFARAQAAVTESQATLDRQRTSLSAAKVDAEKQIEVRANTLRDAQATFAQAQRDKQRAIDDERDPLTGARLTDSGRESYINQAATAERAMQDADRALAQARVDYESAKQAEITGLAEAQARLATAQADLNALLSPNAENVAAARAQLASAEARLAQLTGDQRSGALAAQQAQVEAARAQLNELLADPKSSDLARAEAQVAQAQAQLEQAQIRLDDATLRAPFAGTVAEVNVAPGEQIDQRSPVTLIDTSRYIVKATVDEVDAARVEVGQQVQVLIDALGGPALTGTVKRIAPQAQSGSAVTAYEVTFEVDPASRPVKSGMTASAQIVTDQRDNVLSVPTQAVRTENGQTVVSIITTGSDGREQVTTQVVETGLRTGDRIEIRSGLNEGQRVLLPNAN